MRIFLPIVLACFLAPSSSFADRPIEDLEFAVVPEPDRGILGYPQDLVIRDDETWTRFWEALHPGTQVPEIRFPDRMVVVVALGQQPIGGPSIEVTRVTRQRSPGLTPPLITIHITEYRPGQRCGGPNILTYPYTLVETVASNEVTFRRRTRYVRCG